MKALITGASSGLGKEFAKLLSEKGYDLILVARREERLKELASTLKTDTQIIAMDISSQDNCFELYEEVKEQNIDILINNAGFGTHGLFTETDLEKELNMIDLNCKSLHILTKLFLKDFKKRDSGYIMNVASSAGLVPGGPLMATYYATKAYVVSLTNSIYGELAKTGSNVHICDLCPGPVNTEFNSVADVSFQAKGKSADKVASYALNRMFAGKLNIIPGASMKNLTYLSRLGPKKLSLSVSYDFQKKKNTPAD